MFSSFFGSPRNNYGLQTISTNNSLAPISLSEALSSYTYLVLPTELMDLCTALGGNITTTKKIDEGWFATITSYTSQDARFEKDILRTVSYPPIIFRTFVGRNEDDLKDEAIEYFKKNKLDICNVDNWLVKGE